MKICFVPIDNRPVCYNLAKDIVAIDEDIELFIPPREYLGDLKKSADRAKILEWLKSVPKTDSIILSLDTLTYGGLIPSRRSTDTYESIVNYLNELKQILKEKQAKIYAFSSIMRISNNNYNEEEKEYWSEYGKKIFEYSYNYHKNGEEKSEIPQEILKDYKTTRKRNFEINKIFLDWQKEGVFETLIFSKDDCAEYGLNVMEAIELEKLGGITKTGADEIPLTLLARAINKDIKVYVEFTEPDSKNLISNYEDISIEKSVMSQLMLGGFNVVETEEDSDVVLLVNNFVEKQGELVMGWDTKPYDKNLKLPQKLYAVADVRYANGADNNFVEKLIKQTLDENFSGFSAWNTSANTIGSLLACLKVKFNAKKYNVNAFKKLQMIRFLDDWVYQANVRKIIEYPCDLSDVMKNFEIKLSNVLNYKYKNIKYAFPWDRKFETEVIIEE